MKQFILVVLVVISFSCSKDDDDQNTILTVNVINKSESKIEKAMVYAATSGSVICDSIIFNNIDIDTNAVTKWADIHTCTPTGFFVIEAQLNDTILAASFGEIENNNPVDYLYFIHVFNDRILPGGARDAE